MNPTRKLRKKRTPITQPPQQQQLPTTTNQQQKLATDNLFNLSYCYDQTHPKEANPESDIFNSVESQDEDIGLDCGKNNSGSKANGMKYGWKRMMRKDQHSIELEKLIDKEFIQESKNLLKLYAVQANQNSFRSPQINPKKQGFSAMQPQQIKKLKKNIFCNTFKSDSVFVVTRKAESQRSDFENHKKQLQILNLSPRKMISEKKLPYAQSSYEGRCSFSPQRSYLQTTPKKSFQNTIFNQQPVTKPLPREYQKIQKFKTLNSTKWMFLRHSIEKSMESIKLTPQKDLKELKRKKFHSQERCQQNEEKNRYGTSFRKRHTFYKDHKIKFGLKTTV